MAPDGRSVVVSSAGLEAFTPTRTKDTTFEANATSALVPPYPVYGGPDEVEYQTTGKLIVANADVLYRLTPTGSTDPTFGTGGPVTEPASVLPGFTATDLSVDQQNRIIIGRRSPNNGFALIRYTANGALDTTFGTNGTATYPATIDNGAPPADGRPSPRKIVRGTLADGSILVSFYDAYNIYRITPTGTIDTTFNGTGKLGPTVTNVGGIRQSLFVDAWDLVARPDGSFLSLWTNEVKDSNARLPFLYLQLRRWTAAGGNQLLATVAAGYMAPGTASISGLGDWVVVESLKSETKRFIWFTVGGDPGPQAIQPAGTSDLGPCDLHATLTSVICTYKKAVNYEQSIFTGEIRFANGPAPTPVPPDTPPFFRADQVTSTSVTLGLAGGSEYALGYLVYRVLGGVSTLLPGCSDVQVCRDSGLSPDTHYDYYYYAWNNAGARQPARLSIQTLSLAPTSPIATAAVAAGPNSVLVDWLDRSSNESGFKIYRYLSTGTYVLEATTGPNATSATITNASLNTSSPAIFVVTSFNASGETNDQGYVYTAARGTPITTGPTAPSPLPTRVTGTSATINWTDNATNENGYLVYRVQGTQQTLVTSCPYATSNIASCTDTGLAPDRPTSTTSTPGTTPASATAAHQHSCARRTHSNHQPSPGQIEARPLSACIGSTTQPTRPTSRFTNTPTEPTHWLWLFPPTTPRPPSRPRRA